MGFGKSQWLPKLLMDALEPRVMLSGPPNSPWALNTTFISSSEIDLGWSDNQNAPLASQMIVQASGPGSPATQTLAGNATSCIFTNLNPGSTYTFSLYGQNSSGVSNTLTLTASTAAVTPTPTPTGPPNSPWGLQTTLTSSSEIDLKWSDNQNAPLATQMIVQASGPGSPATQTLFGNATSCIFTNLNPSSTYTFSVYGQNSGGVSNTLTLMASTAAATPTPTPTGPPNSPWGLQTTLTSSSEIDLKWSDNSNAPLASQMIVQASGPGSPATQTLAGNATSCIFTNLNPSSTYTFSVYGQNSSGVSNTLTLTASTAAGGGAGPSTGGVNGITIRIPTDGKDSFGMPTKETIAWTSPAGFIASNFQVLRIDPSTGAATPVSGSIVSTGTNTWSVSDSLANPAGTVQTDTASGVTDANNAANYTYANPTVYTYEVKELVGSQLTSSAVSAPQFYFFTGWSTASDAQATGISVANSLTGIEVHWFSYSYIVSGGLYNVKSGPNTGQWLPNGYLTSAQINQLIQGTSVAVGGYSFGGFSAIKIALALNDPTINRPVNYLALLQPVQYDPALPTSSTTPSVAEPSGVLSVDDWYVPQWTSGHGEESLAGDANDSHAYPTYTSHGYALTDSNVITTLIKNITALNWG